MAKKLPSHLHTIDNKKTGLHLHNLLKDRGLSVKDVQSYLGLSCPQGIYRWLDGRALPASTISMLCRVFSISPSNSCCAALIFRQTKDYSCAVSLTRGSPPPMRRRMRFSPSSTGIPSEMTVYRRYLPVSICPLGCLSIRTRRAF